MKCIGFLSIICVLVLSSSCGNSNKTHDPGNGKDSIPSCLRDQLNSFEKNTPANAPVQVDEYLYKGKQVFLFTADCCDQYNTLYDADCRAICSPSGGLEGKGDHKCDDFTAEAKFVRKIWAKKQ